MSVSLRPKVDIDFLKEVSIDDFSNMPFDTEGIEVAQSEALKKAIMNPK